MTEPTWSHPEDERIAGRNRRLAVRVAISVVVAAAAGLYCYYGRNFMPRFALVSSAAVGVLVFSTLRAVDILRGIYRR